MNRLKTKVEDQVIKIFSSTWSGCHLDCQPSAKNLFFQSMRLKKFHPTTEEKRNLLKKS